MRQRVRAFALGALILYPAGVTLPVIRLERLGHSRETGIVSGGVELLTSGEVALGLLILVCSVAVPLIKLAGLLALSSPWPIEQRSAGRLHRILDATGRWGMLDVLLVAILAASVKLGDLVQISAGPGALAFAGCVALSLVAAACFDPRASWHGESGLVGIPPEANRPDRVQPGGDAGPAEAMA